MRDTVSKCFTYRLHLLRNADGVHDNNSIVWVHDGILCHISRQCVSNPLSVGPSVQRVALRDQEESVCALILQLLQHFPGLEVDCSEPCLESRGQLRLSSGNVTGQQYNLSGQPYLLSADYRPNSLTRRAAARSGGA